MITWGRLTDLIENGKGLDFASTLFFVFSQDDIQLFAIELNTGSQNNSQYGQLFLHGIDANGIPLKSIGGDYADFTKDIKQHLGLPFDRVTLYQEGDFYRSWEFIQKKDEFVLRADTLKENQQFGGLDDLRDRWGSDIIGLTNESINALAEEVLPRLIQYILSKLLS